MTKVSSFRDRHFSIVTDHSRSVSVLAKSLASNVQESISRPSISAGLGIVYKFDPLRVEVNFGVPLVASKSDGHRRGFEVGIGVNFL